MEARLVVGYGLIALILLAVSAIIMHFMRGRRTHWRTMRGKGGRRQAKRRKG